MRSRRLAAAIAAVALVGTLTACTGKDAVGGSGDGFRFVSRLPFGQVYTPAERKTAGQFTAGLLDGKGNFTLDQDLGKVVVLNFWASWCAPCVIESPQFDLVYRDYKSRGVDFVGVDTKDARSAATYFVQNNDISYPIVYDEQGEVAVKIGKIPANGMPFTVLVDKLGKVAGVYIGQMSPKDLEPMLDKLVAEV